MPVFSVIIYCYDVRYLCQTWFQNLRLLYVEIHQKSRRQPALNAWFATFFFLLCQLADDGSSHMPISGHPFCSFELRLLLRFFHVLLALSTLIFLLGLNKYGCISEIDILKNK